MFVLIMEWPGVCVSNFVAFSVTELLLGDCSVNVFEIFLYIPQVLCLVLR